MKSEGTGKGHQCKRCGGKAVAEAKPRRLLPARIHPGTYLPSPRAQRHLTKQLIRYGRESVGTQAVAEGWVGSGSRHQ